MWYGCLSDSLPSTPSLPWAWFGLTGLYSMLAMLLCGVLVQTQFMQAADADRDGHVSTVELEAWVREQGGTDEHVAAMLEHFDANRDNNISVEEIKAYMMETYLARLADDQGNRALTARDAEQISDMVDAAVAAKVGELEATIARLETENAKQVADLTELIQSLLVKK